MKLSARSPVLAWGLVLISASGARADGAEDAGSRSAADEARRAQVVAKGKAFEITLGMLEDQINKQPAALRARYQMPEERKALLENLVRVSLLSEEAERRGLGDSSAVRQTIKDGAVQALVRTDIDEKVTAASISQEDVASYYKAHEADFHHPAERRASHISVATEQEAVALIAQAKQTDLRGFGELARKHSLDNETKLRGGDLAFFTLAPARDAGLRKVPDPIRKAVFELKAVGDIVEKPIALDGQYSVVRFTGERPERHVTLAEAEGSIRSRLWRERRQKALNGLIDKLRTKLKPQVFAQRIDQIKFDDMEKRPSGFAPDPLPRPAQPGPDAAKKAVR